MKFLQFSSLYDLQAAFLDEKTAVAYMERMRWGFTVRSPFDPSSKVYKCKNGQYKCSATNRYFNVRTNSIFADTKLPLRMWLMAIYLFSSHKRGISSVQLGKDLGVRQATAWFIEQRLRYAMGRESFFELPLTGTVELDEAYLGGEEKNKHESKKGIERVNEKAVVLGIVQRKGKAKLIHVPDNKQESIEPHIYKNVDPSASIMSDEGGAYARIRSDYKHQTIKHASKEYVREEVHTNTIENAWSQLKRGIYGTYYWTSKKHLQAYLNEFTFRYNRRKSDEYGKLNDCLINAYRGRLRYKDLIAKAK